MASAMDVITITIINKTHNNNSALRRNYTPKS